MCRVSVSFYSKTVIRGERKKFFLSNCACVVSTYINQQLLHKIQQQQKKKDILYLSSSYCGTNNRAVFLYNIHKLDI